MPPAAAAASVRIAGWGDPAGKRPAPTLNRRGPVLFLSGRAESANGRVQVNLVGAVGVLKTHNGLVNLGAVRQDMDQFTLSREEIEKLIGESFWASVHTIVAGRASAC
jgi:hypothetical protein